MKPINLKELIAGMSDAELKRELLISLNHLDQNFGNEHDISDTIDELVFASSIVLRSDPVSNQWYGRFLREEAGLLKENGLYAQIDDEGVSKIAGLSARQKGECMLLAISKSKKETKS